MIALAAVLVLTMMGNAAKSDSGKNETEEKGTRVYEVWTGNALEHLDEKQKEDVISYYGFTEDDFKNGIVSQYFTDDNISQAGTVLEMDPVTDINGNTIDLTEGNVIIEVVASWCEFSQKMSADYMHEIVEAYPDIKFVQYISDAESISTVNEFYANAAASIPEGLYVITQNDDIDKWLSKNTLLHGFPTFYMLEDGKLGMIQVGYTSSSLIGIKINYNYADGLSRIYDFKDKDGVLLRDDIKNQEIIQEYIDSLTEIEGPDDLLDNGSEE